METNTWQNAHERMYCVTTYLQCSSLLQWKYHVVITNNISAMFNYFYASCVPEKKTKNDNSCP